jgi:hypothetical protein
VHDKRVEVLGQTASRGGELLVVQLRRALEGAAGVGLADRVVQRPLVCLADAVTSSLTQCSEPVDGRFTAGASLMVARCVGPGARRWAEAAQRCSASPLMYVPHLPELSVRSGPKDVLLPVCVDRDRWRGA